MVVAVVPLVVLVVGLLAYGLAAKAEVKEAGRIAYAVGLFWLVYGFIGHVLKL